MLTRGPASSGPPVTLLPWTHLYSPQVSPVEETRRPATSSLHCGGSGSMNVHLCLPFTMTGSQSSLSKVQARRVFASGCGACVTCVCVSVCVSWEQGLPVLLDPQEYGQGT